VPRTIQATEPQGEHLRIGIVVARFNQGGDGRAARGALDALERHGVATDAIDVAIVPGAFELPLCAPSGSPRPGRYDALVCLGRRRARRDRRTSTTSRPRRRAASARWRGASTFP
jgi:6,7-dimethyl-8-ribityllumazine synthase